MSMTKSRTAPRMAVTYFAWLGGIVGEVDAAHHAALGHRSVRLGEVERMPDRLLETVESVPLQEHTAVVAELLSGVIS